MQKAHGQTDKAPAADPEAREFLRKSDPVMARLPDVFLPGDLALRHAVEWAYGLDHLPSEEEMDERAERWRPYRSLAAAYLFASAYNA